jgi:hypothetical protein
MTEDKKVKKARTFGAWGDQRQAIKLYEEKRDGLVKDIICDFKVWQIQWDSNNDERVNTLERLAFNLKDLKELERWVKKENLYELDK